MARYFGTDGIRKKVGTPPITPLGMTRLGEALWAWLTATVEGTPHIAVGWDTRASSGWIMHALTAPMRARGARIDLLGEASTPELARYTRTSEAMLGIMITASHNPATDNGVKLFDGAGFKLPGDAQTWIESLMGELTDSGFIPGDPYKVNLVEWGEPELAPYGLEAGALEGLHIVLDAAHGGGAPRAGAVLTAFGATVTSIGVEPNGVNINDGLGATHTDALAAKVVELGAYAGLALDGDADRGIMVDETGAEVDGDQLIALFATVMQAEGRLTGGGVVATVMSNLGLERYLSERGLNLQRTGVGDKLVVEAMRAGGYNLGGEQSGHIVLLDHTTTGDGLLAGLHALAIAKADGRKFSEISRVFEPVPQKLVNVRFEGESPMRTDAVQAAMYSVANRLGADGRVLVRESGTEPLIRIMVEARDPDALAAALDELETAVRAGLA